MTVGTAWIIRAIEAAVTFFVVDAVELLWNAIHQGHVTTSQALVNALIAAGLGAAAATIKHFTGVTYLDVVRGPRGATRR